MEHTARLATPAPPWSKPPGLPCRRSRRQSNTIPNATGVPTPSGPHDCALHLNPPPLFLSPCPPCPPWFIFSVFSVFSVVCFFRALHVVSDVRQAFQPALAPLPSALLHPIAPPVEQAARLAMPAITPAEPHNPERYGSPHAIRPAQLRAPPQPAAARWSKPPGLPCRRSRRQSHTIPSCAGVPTPSGPHACALHLNPPPQGGASR